MAGARTLHALPYGASQGRVADGGPGARWRVWQQPHLSVGRGECPMGAAEKWSTVSAPVRYRRSLLVLVCVTGLLAGGVALIALCAAEGRDKPSGNLQSPTRPLSCVILIR